jgi:hypothetical protein
LVASRFAPGDPAASTDFPPGKFLAANLSVEVPGPGWIAAGGAALVGSGGDDTEDL